MPVPDLGRHISRLGFTGLELPVRPGFQVEPENVARDLPRVAGQLADFGLAITSIAGPTDERTLAACAEAGIPLVRIMISIGPDGYRAAEARAQKEFDALVPLLEQYGVRIGVQNHCGRCVCNAAGLQRLLEPYDPRHIAAVWDAAHNALQGEDPELAIEIVWPHLEMVNLKNAFWRRLDGRQAEWQPYWTTGREGLASWPRVAAELKRRDYQGVLCLTAEYSDEEQVDRLIAEDIALATSLFA